MDEHQLELFFYPLGSRSLSLASPQSRGSDVWLLQRWLNRVPKIQPAWSLARIPESGVFSNGLLLGIRTLAKQLMLWQPWYICDVSYLMLGQLTQRFLPGKIGFGVRPLMVGDEGHDVWVLQNRLVGASRRLALVLGRVPDGVYDQRTARMVRVFQRDSQTNFPQLRATGQVGADSFLAIWDRTILGGRELKPGDRGLDVLSLQELLIAQGYRTDLSGIFDATMLKTYSAWQQSQELEATGRFTALECWRLGLERG